MQNRIDGVKRFWPVERDRQDAARSAARNGLIA
jgi:hypothetical protein